MYSLGFASKASITSGSSKFRKITFFPDRFFCSNLRIVVFPDCRGPFMAYASFRSSHLVRFFRMSLG